MFNELDGLYAPEPVVRFDEFTEEIIVEDMPAKRWNTYAGASSSSESDGYDLDEREKMMQGWFEIA